MVNRKYCIIPVFVPHIGCPHDCIFCNQKKITGNEQEIMASDVENLIDTYLKTMDRNNTHVELSFFGGSFTGIPLNYQNELLNVAKEAFENGKIDDIRLSTRPDYINEEILNNLKEHHVGIIELGVQSMDEYVLDIAQRQHTALDVVKSSELIKKWGFKLGLQMMVGLPGDNKEKDLFTANEIIKLRPDFVRIYPALVIRDTYMETMYKNSTFKPLSVEEAVDICKELYKEFMRENIPIIRIGLQPTEQINLGKDVIAGPFHPSFRELVESSILNDMIEKTIKSYYFDSNNIDIYIGSRDISKLYANKKKYFKDKIKLFMTKNINIIQKQDMKSMGLIFSDGKLTRKMSIDCYINMNE